MIGMETGVFNCHRPLGMLGDVLAYGELMNALEWRTACAAGLIAVIIALCPLARWFRIGLCAGCALASVLLVNDLFQINYPPPYSAPVMSIPEWLSLAALGLCLFPARTKNDKRTCKEL